MIAVVDYGMGNLRSVQKALERCGADAAITSDPHTIERAEKVVLPGVGAFRDAMAELRNRRLIDPVQKAAREKPFLGICLGLQLLFTESKEGGLYPGLNILPGRVVRFASAGSGSGGKRKVPHMGWNALQFRKNIPLWRNVPDGACVYFVHSYCVVPDDESVVAAVTEYGETFVSAVARDCLFATQFHPEKSQEVGIRILRNFVEL